MRQIASLQQDGMSKFTMRCSGAVALARTNFFTCQCVKLGCGTHDIERVLSSVAQGLTSLSPDGKWQIYFGKNANPMVLHLSGMCVSHRDTPVPTEDTTSLRPSTSLRPPSSPRRLLAIDHEDGFTKLCVLIWKSSSGNMYASTFMRPCTVWLDPELCSCARCGEFTMGGEDAPDMMTPHLSQKHVHLQLQCFGKLLGGRRIIGTDVAELSGRQVPTSMPRSHG